MSRVTAPPGRFLIGATTALVILLCLAPQCSAEGQPAVVEGTTQLFIRRGPGREFPPFATLTGGSQVEVQERHGTWARVTTASGQVGYVHGKYLRLLKTTSPTVSAEHSPAPPMAARTTAVTPPTRRAQAAGTPTRARNAERATTRPAASPTPPPIDAEMTATPSATMVRAAQAPGSDSPSVEPEIVRLSEAVEALNRRLDQRFPLPDAGAGPTLESDSGVSGGAILLGLAGVIVGWFLGSTYQRNKERGRRSRIRL